MFCPKLGNIFWTSRITLLINRITASDKVLHWKAVNIMNNSEYDEYQRSLGSIGKFFNKLKGSGAAMCAATADIAFITRNQKSTDKLHKPIMKKLQNAICIYLLCTTWMPILLICN